MAPKVRALRIFLKHFIQNKFSRKSKASDLDKFFYMLDPEPVTIGRKGWNDWKKRMERLEEKDGTMGRGGTGKHGWNIEG